MPLTPCSRAFELCRVRPRGGWPEQRNSTSTALFLGYRLNQAGVSAIEKTYDSERRRNIDVAEIVAYSRCFGFPIGWFFLPPAGHTDDLIEPVQTGPLAGSATRGRRGTGRTSLSPIFQTHVGYCRRVGDVEALIPGAQGRVLGALVRLDGPRTISELARLADVSRDRAATVVDVLEQLGLVERRHAGRAHLVSLIDEHPLTQSLREIDRARERAIDALRESASELEPAPSYMALYGSWARGEATAGSDLDVAVIADAAHDLDDLLAALEAWSRFAKRATGRNPSLVIADGARKARGALWSSVRRDAIVLVDTPGVDDGP